jgi:hypothetical protein
MRKTTSLWIPLFLAVALVPGVLADLAPEAVLAAVEDLYTPSPFGPRAPGDQRAEFDAHLLVRKAHRLLQEDIDSDVSERLRELLAPPPEVFETRGSPLAPSGAGYQELRTAHFRVLYKTSGSNAVKQDKDQDGIPDKAAWVAAAFENAYKFEVETSGYPSPPDIPNYTIVLKRLKVNALTHPEAGGKTWCEFNFAMREGSSDAKIKAKFLAVSAHEFFHAVQALLNWDEADWWVEGSSDWMSELANPGNGFFHSNASLRLERPEIGLESDEPFFAYAGSLFAAYLSNSRTEKGKEDMVKQVWLLCGKLLRAASKEGKKQSSFVKQAVSQLLGSFDETVTRFWPHVYLRNFPGGAKLPRALRVRVKQYPATVKTGTLPKPDRYGANFFEFHPEAGHENSTLELRLLPTKGGKLGVRLIGMGKRWHSIEVTAGEDGVFVAHIKGLGSTWKAATLSVVGLGRKTSFKIDASWID